MKLQLSVLLFPYGIFSVTQKFSFLIHFLSATTMRGKIATAIKQSGFIRLLILFIVSVCCAAILNEVTHSAIITYLGLRKPFCV